MNTRLVATGVTLVLVFNAVAVLAMPGGTETIERESFTYEDAPRETVPSPVGMAADLGTLADVVADARRDIALGNDPSETIQKLTSTKTQGFASYSVGDLEPEAVERCDNGEYVPGLSLAGNVVNACNPFEVYDFNNPGVSGLMLGTFWGHEEAFGGSPALFDPDAAVFLAFLGGFIGNCGHPESTICPPEAHAEFAGTPISGPYSANPSGYSYSLSGPEGFSVSVSGSWDGDCTLSCFRSIVDQGDVLAASVGLGGPSALFTFGITEEGTYGAAGLPGDLDVP